MKTDKLFCPNLSNKAVKAEFEELVDVVGEDAAYDIWNKNNGYGIDRAPNGEPSILFDELLMLFNGDRSLAITYKALALSDESLAKQDAGNYELDDNGEATSESLEHTLSEDVQKRMEQDFIKTNKVSYTEGMEPTDALIELQQLATSQDAFTRRAAKVALKMYEKYGIAVPKVRRANNLRSAGRSLMGQWSHNTKTGVTEVRINNDHPFESVEEYQHTMLHEIFHDITFRVISRDPVAAAKLTELFQQYLEAYPSTKEYARRDILEFISELFSNPETFARAKEVYAANDTRSLGQKIIDFFNELFGLKSNNPFAIIERLIEHKVEIEGKLDLFSDELDDEIVKGLAATSQRAADDLKRAELISADIMHGLKGRIKAAAKRAGTLNAERELRQTLRYLENAQEDQETLIRFIRYAAVDIEKPLRFLNKVHAGQTKISDAELLRLNEDIIGYYAPIIKDINQLYTNDYFAGLSQEQAEQIGKLLTALNNAIVIIEAKYSTLRSDRVKEALLEIGVKANSPTMEDWVNNSTLEIATDISWLERTFGSLSNVNNETLRAIYFTVENAKHDVEEFVRQKGRKLLELQAKVKHTDIPLLFERDSKGRKTGYLVSDRLYGKANADFQDFVDNFKAEHFPDNEDNNPVTHEEQRLFNKARNEWLAKYMERPMKPEFYQVYENLSEEATMVRDNIQAQISNIYELMKDGDITSLSDADYARLEALLKQKRELANEYTRQGFKKADIDLQIAQEIAEVNRRMQENVQYDKDVAAWEAAREKVRKADPSQLAKWDRRNTEEVYDQEFWDLLDEIERTSYGPRYEELKETRNEISKLFRNLNNIEINGNDIVAKEAGDTRKVLEAIDREMSRIRAETVNAKSSGPKFSDIAEIVTTEAYRIAFMAAQLNDRKNPGALNQFIQETSYIDAKTGKRTIYSYWTKIIPKDMKYVKQVPSKVWSEISPESVWYNKNYDRNNPEYLQPKKEFYDNSKAWEKVKNNPNLMALRNALHETMMESNAKIEYRRYPKNLRLPQINGSTYQFLKNGKRGLRNLLKNAVTITKDDTDYTEQLPLRPNGSRVYFVPTHYISPLDDQNNMTNDITGAVIAYLQMAENFEKMNALVPTIELIHEQMGEAKNLNKIKPTQRVEAALKGEPLDVERIKPYAYEKLQDYMKTRIYGDTKQRLEMNLMNPKDLYRGIYNALHQAEIQADPTKRKELQGGYKISFGKIVTMSNKWTTTVNLMYNMHAAVVGVATGLHQVLAEAAGSRVYTTKAATIGFMKTLFDAVKYIGLAQGSRHLANNKTIGLLEYHQISNGNNELFENANQYPVFRWLQKALTWGMWTGGDFVIKGTVINAIYSSYKLITMPDGTKQFVNINQFKESFTGTPEDAKLIFDSTKISLSDVIEMRNGGVVVKEQYQQYYTNDLRNEVTNMGKYLTSRADMMLLPEDKSIIHRNVFGAAIALHKAWMITTLQQRFTKKHGYNYQIGMADEALYRTPFSKKLWSDQIIPRIINLLRSKDYQVEVEKMDPVQKANLKTILFEISSIILLKLYIDSVVDDWDDDKNNLLLQTYAYIMRRFQLEMRAPFNPFEVMGMIKSPSASVSLFEQLSFLTNVFNDNYDKTIIRGPYKNMPAYQRSLIKVTPFKHIIESKDPRSKRNYLENQIMN